MSSARLCSFGIFVGAVASMLEAAAPARAMAGPSIPAAPAAVVAALRVSPEAPELTVRPDLVGRLSKTPQNYFRFVNRPFAEAVCALFDDIRGGLPDVNLHGDAHVEQYAVTSLGRGLSDFDDSARGPYVVDLVRFGVSLELVGREHGWQGAGGAFDEFLRGYRDALSRPSVDRPPERTLRRVLAQFAFDHGLALRRAEALIGSNPVLPSELAADFQGYVARMRAETPTLPPSFFRIKKAGRLKTGIGSALDEKYLLRIEGWTTREDDDQILEAKLVRTLSPTGCVHSEAGPARVTLGMSLIAQASFLFSGLFARGDCPFWVHAWTDDYVELSIESAFPEPRDLRQVAYDVGTQLGRAHPKERPGSDSPRGSRMRLLESTRADEARIRGAIDELTEATVEAWQAFRRRANGSTGALSVTCSSAAWSARPPADGEGVGPLRSRQARARSGSMRRRSLSMLLDEIGGTPDPAGTGERLLDRGDVVLELAVIEDAHDGGAQVAGAETALVQPQPDSRIGDAHGHVALIGEHRNSHDRRAGVQ
jgi:hypothetical protein